MTKNLFNVFSLGDDRVNEQPFLIVQHTIWTREHNRVAAELQTLHPEWDDERLYQEARKIIIAEVSHIAFNAWRLWIVGIDYMLKYNLPPQRYAYSQDYDPCINPSITNEFTTAAFRYDHSMLTSPVA